VIRAKVVATVFGVQAGVVGVDMLFEMVCVCLVGFPPGIPDVFMQIATVIGRLQRATSAQVCSSIKYWGASWLGHIPMCLGERVGVHSLT
jgi:hypothetical protein